MFGTVLMKHESLDDITSICSTVEMFHWTIGFQSVCNPNGRVLITKENPPIFESRRTRMLDILGFAFRSHVPQQNTAKRATIAVIGI